MRNANSYWPGCNSGATATQCNGNGNKFIGWDGADSGSSNGTDDNETFRAWQHLSLSNLISRTFSGVSLGGTDLATPNDMYFSSTGKGKYFLDSANMMFNRQKSNYAVLGTSVLGQNIWMPTLTVREASEIDRKIDDGVASQGKVFGATGLGTGSDTNCSEIYNSASTGADYNTANLSNDTKYCVMAFYFDF
ncbi:MAG: hypothetical protein COV35_10920 [Alphaproteobacteria bacterium CG11_big_fil_rev_8_21_14_0_20_39_49]|nr:MAG: hypothetical protein COV35_10920 [Alphaproteobacteria bacterium CG11_big_fil_rev_8_21_14_0_20_39_49]